MSANEVHGPITIPVGGCSSVEVFRFLDSSAGEKGRKGDARRISGDRQRDESLRSHSQAAEAQSGEVLYF